MLTNSLFGPLIGSHMIEKLVALFAASSLLDLPEYFTPCRNTKRLNLFALRQRFPKLLFADMFESDPIDKFCTFSSIQRIAS